MKEIIENNLRWLDFENPSKEDIGKLEREFNFHPLALEDCLTSVHRPKIDEFSDHLFIVVQFPVFEKKSRRITPSEVDIFVGKNYLVTIHEGNLKPLTKLFDDCLDNKSFRETVFKREIGFLLYTVLNNLVDYCFPVLYKNDDNLTRLEQEMFEQEEFGRLVKDLSIERRNILNYRKIIKPQINVLKELEDKYVKVDLPKYDVYFGELADHIEKIWDGLEDQKEVVEGLYESNLALVNNHTNDVMRILTTMSVIFLPLTLVASVYGMNVQLPLSETPFAFQAVLVVMWLILLAMLYFFRKKNLL